MYLVVSHTAIDLDATKYNLTFLHESLPHPPYNNFSKVAVFLKVNNVN